MNRVCRRMCALSFSALMSLSWVWVRSSSNPSNYPSRLPARLAKNVERSWVPDLTMHGDVHPRPGPRHKVPSVYNGPIVRYEKDEPLRGPVGLVLASIARPSAAKYLRATLAFGDWYNLHGDRNDTLENTLADYTFWCYDTEQVSRGVVKCKTCFLVWLC